MGENSPNLVTLPFVHGWVCLHVSLAFDGVAAVVVVVVGTWTGWR
jgi:hypothetical protein